MDAYGDEDFGPETDVDVVDEAMHSPTLTATIKDNNLSTIDFNLKSTAADIITNNDDNNTLQLLDNNLHHNNFKNDLIKEQDNNINDVTNDFHINNHNNHQIIDDNKLYEATGGIATATDDAQIMELNSNNGDLNHTIKKEIDFSEKREYSFECEEYEKELNTMSDAALELMSTVSDAFSVSDALATPVLAADIEPIGAVDFVEPKNGKFLFIFIAITYVTPFI